MLTSEQNVDCRKVSLKYNIIRNYIIHIDIITIIIHIYSYGFMSIRMVLKIIAAKKRCRPVPPPMPVLSS